MNLGQNQFGMTRAASKINSYQLSIVLIFGTSLYGGDTISPTMPPNGLMCELMTAPEKVDICDPLPKFGWIVPVAGGSGMQKAYQILVAGDPKLLVEGRADLWDSGKVQSDQSVSVQYAGKPLESNHSYGWMARVWNNEDRPSPWSGR